MKNATTTNNSKLDRKAIIAQMESLGLTVRTRNSAKQLNEQLQRHLAKLEAEKPAPKAGKVKMYHGSQLQSEEVDGVNVISVKPGEKPIERKKREANRVELTEEMEKVLAIGGTKVRTFKELEELGMPAMQIAEVTNSRPAFVYNVLNGVYGRHKMRFQTRGLVIDYTYTGRKSIGDVQGINDLIEEALQDLGTAIISMEHKELRQHFLDLLKPEKVCAITIKNKEA